MENRGSVNTCVVCGEVSDQVAQHYSRLLCNGCRAFFKRVVQSGIPKDCKTGGNCVVDHSSRKACKACRYQACINAGVDPSKVQVTKENNQNNRNQQLYQQHAFETPDAPSKSQSGQLPPINSAPSMSPRVPQPRELQVPHVSQMWHPPHPFINVHPFTANSGLPSSQISFYNVSHPFLLNNYGSYQHSLNVAQANVWQFQSIVASNSHKFDPRNLVPDQTSSLFMRDRNSAFSVVSSHPSNRNTNEHDFKRDPQRESHNDINTSHLATSPLQRLPTLCYPASVVPVAQNVNTLAKSLSPRLVNGQSVTSKESNSQNNCAKNELAERSSQLSINSQAFMIDTLVKPRADETTDRQISHANKFNLITPVPTAHFPSPSHYSHHPISFSRESSINVHNPTSSSMSSTAPLVIFGTDQLYSHCGTLRNQVVASVDSIQASPPVDALFVSLGSTDTTTASASKPEELFAAGRRSESRDIDVRLVKTETSLDDTLEEIDVTSIWKDSEDLLPDIAEQRESSTETVNDSEIGSEVGSGISHHIDSTMGLVDVNIEEQLDAEYELTKASCSAWKSQAGEAGEKTVPDSANSPGKESKQGGPLDMTDSVTASGQTSPSQVTSTGKVVNILETEINHMSSKLRRGNIIDQNSQDMPDQRKDINNETDEPIQSSGRTQSCPLGLENDKHKSGNIIVVVSDTEKSLLYAKEGAVEQEHISVHINKTRHVTDQNVKHLVTSVLETPGSTKAQDEHNITAGHTDLSTNSSDKESQSESADSGLGISVRSSNQTLSSSQSSSTDSDDSHGKGCEKNGFVEVRKAVSETPAENGGVGGSGKMEDCSVADTLFTDTDHLTPKKQIQGYNHKSKENHDSDKKQKGAVDKDTSYSTPIKRRRLNEITDNGQNEQPLEGKNDKEIKTFNETSHVNGTENEHVPLGLGKSLKRRLGTKFTSTPMTSATDIFPRQQFSSLMCDLIDFFETVKPKTQLSVATTSNSSSPDIARTALFIPKVSSDNTAIPSTQGNEIGSSEAVCATENKLEVFQDSLWRRLHFDTSYTVQQFRQDLKEYRALLQSTTLSCQLKLDDSW